MAMVYDRELGHRFRIRIESTLTGETYGAEVFVSALELERLWCTTGLVRDYINRGVCKVVDRMLADAIDKGVFK